MRSPAAALALAALLVAGCEQPPEQRVTTPPSVSKTNALPLTPASQEQARNLKQLGQEWLTQLVDCTTLLETDTRQFLAISNDAGLENVKQLWHTCHTLYRATELLLGVTPEQQQAMQRARRNIASPLEMPGYVDSIEGYAGSGIVNDASLTISEANLRQQHGLTSDEDVAIGFDVIAFLVWGEQRFNPQLAPRPLSELTYTAAWENGRTDLPVSEHPQNRRRLYLQLASTLLKLDCSRLLAVWQKGPLPRSEDEARQWKLQTLQNGLALLERYPDNSDVSMALSQWLSTTSATASNQSSDGAITVATDPAELRNNVQQAIKALTGQG
ncbi:MAG: imelysin family protein [Gammaproteobacteria bacterium]